MLLITDAHSLYCHMDATWSILLGHSYSENPNYLVIKILMSIAIQFPDSAILTGPHVYNFTNSSLAWWGMLHMGLIITILKPSLIYDINL